MVAIFLTIFGGYMLCYGYTYTIKLDSPKSWNLNQLKMRYL